MLLLPVSLTEYRLLSETDIKKLKRKQSILKEPEMRVHFGFFLFMKAMLQRPGLLEILANAVIKTVYEAIYVLIDLPHLSRLLLLKPYRLHAPLSSQSLQY